MAFNAGQMLVFNRAGNRLGVLTNWSVSVPRSYRFREIEDFAFHIPLTTQDGTDFLDAAMVTLLARDNLIYVEDEIFGLPGWGGAIDYADFGDDRVVVRCLGGTSLLTALQCDRIFQTAGSSATVAERLVAAANAKKSAHGDLVLGFVAEESPPLYGSYDYVGDVYAGLASLATDTLAEFHARATLGSGGATLAIDILWNKRRAIDHTSVILTDGGGATPNLKAGSHFLYSGLEVLNHIILKGAPTHFADFLDYDCIKSVVKDVSPIVEWTLDDPTGTARRREDTQLTVNFGLSDDFQRQIAVEGWTDPLTLEHVPGIQQSYLAYYKSFLYAYHHRQGKPFLEGYDWSGPDGSNDIGLTERHYRTWNKLGHALNAHVVTTETDGDIVNATIEDWAIDTSLSPVAQAVGVALDYGTTTSHWIADKATGNLYLLAADNTTLTLWGSVGSPGTLLSVATDAAAMNEVWVLVGNTIKNYDADDKTLIAQYNISGALGANDIALDVAGGKLYVSGTGTPNVTVLDVNSGLPIAPDPSFPSGFGANTGISISGGVAYVSDAAGNIRMLSVADGAFQGTFASAVPTDALFVDPSNRRIYLVAADGTINVYHAVVALGTISGPGGVLGAAGFDEIMVGQYVHIVMHSALTQGPANKPTAGADGTYTVRGPIGTDHDSLWKIAVRFYGNGSLWRTIYKANKATIGANPSLIFPGQVFRIPNAKHTPPAPPAATKYLHVYTHARWEENTVPGPIGQPDQILREWVLTSDQIVAHSTSANIAIDSPDVVIYGEEGRVCDWNPTLDGYGQLKEDQLYRTKAGHIVKTGHGWYPHDWDVPESVFQPPQKPAWPEGEAFAADYLLYRNREVTVQTIVVTNADGLWGQIELGGLYTIQATKQGVRPSGITLTIRVLAFSPNELTGELSITAEVN